MGQISGLGGIRWEDQQKIQEKVEGSGQEATDGPSVEDFKMNENFKVEYAPSGRAACRHCTNKIEKVQIIMELKEIIIGVWRIIKCN